MAIHSRAERYAKIRRKLDFPLEQKPSPDQILTQMLMQDQELNIEIGNTEPAWSLLPPVTITTVAGTSDYTISQPVDKNTEGGKPFFVLRSTNNVDLPSIEIPFDDFSSQDYGRMPIGVNQRFEMPEKVSFYRANIQDQSRQIVIQPTPREVLSYSVYFSTGSLDRQAATWAKSGQITDLVDWQDLQSMLALITVCEWRGLTAEENEAKARRLIGNPQTHGLSWELARLTPKAEKFISQIAVGTSFEVPHWNQHR